MARYQIAEWFGRPLESLPVPERQSLAKSALQGAPVPNCPFIHRNSPCSKKGGVCSIRGPSGPPVTICPKRLAEADTVPKWLARIAGFREVYMAREVPFMKSPITGRPAGRIDLVIAGDREAASWFGLEVQAVYFSGSGMRADFEQLLLSDTAEVPQPTANRRPDWRSSSAKRLMPQLQVKGPTMRRWGAKLAVAVDQPFFDAIGGPSRTASTDLNDGDIIWLVVRVNPEFRLVPHHWEVLSLEASCEKLISAETIKRHEFESNLRQRLSRLP
ncbi:MAG: NotI family restriction endonuclease [Bacteroidota bacterium]|nr:NotI family restriction endonuclease [Bacteroidota bacterium]